MCSKFANFYYIASQETLRLTLATAEVHGAHRIELLGDSMRKKKITIYGNKIIESSNKYDFISNLSIIEKDILGICRDIEFRHHFHF